MGWRGVGVVGGNILILTKKFYYLIIHCKFQPLVLNAYLKKMIFQLFPHTNQQKHKYDLAVKNHRSTYDHHLNKIDKG